jgi:hypothetical protein
MLVVASRRGVTASTLAAFVDVITGVSGLAVIDDAFMDRGFHAPSWCGLGMNQGLFLLLRALRRLLRGKPTMPRGGTFDLLHGHSLEETSNLIAGSMGLGGRWLRHIAEKHGGSDDVLAGLVEDWGFTHLVLDDATIDVAGSVLSPSATCVRRALSLEGLLK